MRRAIIVLVFLSWLGAAAGFKSACSAESNTITITVKNTTLVVEVADDPRERSRGLMYRRILEEYSGMLFVYPDSKSRAFWMKNTIIPLSIAYIDERGIIIGILDMEPLNDRVFYPSPGSAKYALEVNRGWFERHGITVGDKLEFR